jgi:hypothetical protein
MNETNDEFNFPRVLHRNNFCNMALAKKRKDVQHKFAAPVNTASKGMPIINHVHIWARKSSTHYVSS